jgi:hypothetical protein
MKSKFLFIALIFLSSRSYSQWYSQWEKVATGPDSTFFYVNPLYVSEVKDDMGNKYIKAWVKTNSKKFIAGDGKEYDNVELKTLYWFDCINARMKISSFTMSKSTGEVIMNHDAQSDLTVKWINIVPESIAETLATKICSLKK